MPYDEYAGSDDDSHDAYLERMKEEGKIREENANDSSEDSGEETGKPFLPAATLSWTLLSSSWDRSLCAFLHVVFFLWVTNKDFLF